MSGAHDRGPGLVSRRAIHEGRIVRLSVDTVRFPDGSIGELELIRHPGAAAVVPIVDNVGDPDPHVLLIHQYRYAAGGYVYEVPAGVRDADDPDWESCARRELEEETGFRAGRLDFLTSVLTTPGFTDEEIHLFLASELEPGRRSLDDDEFVEVVRVPLREALLWVRDGRIRDGKSVAALLYAATFFRGPEIESSESSR